MATIHIIESSWLARLATWYMRSNAVAMVWGSRILLWGVSKQEFLKNTRWVRHELKHVEQYQRLGVARFLVYYLWEWLLVGYHNNRFEVEARAAEYANG